MIVAVGSGSIVTNSMERREVDGQAVCKKACEHKTGFNFHRWKQRGSLDNCFAKSIILSLYKIANRLMFDIWAFLGRRSVCNN